MLDESGCVIHFTGRRRDVECLCCDRPITSPDVAYFRLCRDCNAPDHSPDPLKGCRNADDTPYHKNLPISAKRKIVSAVRRGIATQRAMARAHGVSPAYICTLVNNPPMELSL